jgi:predicted DNA-binding transcriptional regulator AlpA
MINKGLLERFHIARLYRVSRTTAEVWSKLPTFPEPVQGSGVLQWESEKVREWVEQNTHLGARKSDGTQRRLLNRGVKAPNRVSV